MVSKASEDLPEPERPVNTTSLSRGIATSTFLRLCSRAPRMVMARWSGLNGKSVMETLACRGARRGRAALRSRLDMLCRERSENDATLPGLRPGRGLESGDLRGRGGGKRADSAEGNLPRRYMRWRRPNISMW